MLVPKELASGPASPSGGPASRSDHGASGPGSGDGRAAPAVQAPQVPALAPNTAKESVVVPADEFVYPDRRRVFYRVLAGDTPREIAGALHVSPDDLFRWNALDAGARLQEGMTLQAFVPPDADLAGIRVLPESSVHVVAVGSEEFFAPIEQTKGVRRLTVAAKDGDTLESIGSRLGIAAHTMEWINRRGRGEPLRAGDSVVVYLPDRGPSPVADALPAPNAPVPNGPLPVAPQPDQLP